QPAWLCPHLLHPSAAILVDLVHFEDFPDHRFQVRALIGGQIPFQRGGDLEDPDHCSNCHVLPLQSTGISVQAETGNGDSHTSETGTLTVNSTNGTKCECPRFTSLLLLMRTPGTRSEQPDSSPVLTIRSWSIARMTVARRRSSTHEPPYTGS